MTVIFHGQLLRAAYQVASVWPTERKPKAWPRLTDEEKGKGDKTTTKHAIAPFNCHKNFLSFDVHYMK
jgi:hypothetical protein